MSKQQRSPAHKRNQASPQSDVDAERANAAVEQSNQAVLEQLGPSTSAPSADVEAARSVALPLVERGVFALFEEPRAPGVIERYCAVIEGSQLPSSQKAVLVDRLVAGQEASVAAVEAASRWFGSRAAAHEVLEGVWAGLQGVPEAGVLDGGGGPSGAERWIADLAGDSAEAVLGFCQEVYLILAFEEEEEEEDMLGIPGMEM